MASRPPETMPGLHARLALLDHDPRYVTEIAAYIPSCRPDELLPCRELLKPHAGSVLPGLWKVLLDGSAQPRQRVRAASALASFVPQDSRWSAVADDIVVAVLHSSSNEFVVWAQALEPVRDLLLAPLQRLYPELKRRLDSGRLSGSELAEVATGFDLAATLIARYTADRPTELAALPMVIDARHYRRFEAAFGEHREVIIRSIKDELARPPFPGPTAVGGALAAVAGTPNSLSRQSPDPAFDALAKRQASAAAVLMMLGDVEGVWRLFRHSADPSLRSYLIEYVARVGFDPLKLIQRARAEPDMSAKRAILIALGGIPPTTSWQAERETFTLELLELYRAHPDAGLHSAIEWLLKQSWGRTKEVAAIDAELAADRRFRAGLRKVLGQVSLPPVAVLGELASETLLPAGRGTKERDWFVSGEQQTFTVVNGPLEKKLDLVKDLPVEKRLEGVPVEKRLEGVPLEQMVQDLTPEQRQQLLRLLLESGGSN
jgi:hypothetical protein